MAASIFLQQSFTSRKSPISKSGVLTIHGFGVRVRVQSGHLEVEDGVGMDRRKIRLARVGHGLRRLVCVSDDGTISLSALRWVTEQKVAFVLLQRDGRVLTVCGPSSPSQVRLRRAQALAHHTGKALEISRRLISVKLEGEETVLREQLQQPAVADSIAELRERLADAENLDRVRYLEAVAAKNYWRAWSEVPILFPRADTRRVPAHWLKFGSRHSHITGGPRLAINPPNAILNYCFALAESECRLALCGCGLDPGCGFVHLDTANRDSLALDLLETIRPSIESWLLNWITREALRCSDFFETGSGNCRLRSGICAQLSETAPTWGRLVGSWAEYVAHTLWAGRSSSDSPATRLAERDKREAKGRASLPPSISVPKREHLCRGCGKTIQSGRVNCAGCAVDDATKNMLDAARIGRLTANGPEAQAKRAIKARKNALAQHSWKASDQSAWLNQELFEQKVQPLLAKVSMSVIRSSIGVSKWYASKIRQGYRPHPRHWEALAELVGCCENNVDRSELKHHGHNDSQRRRVGKRIASL
jgi:CRISPR-associated endonuclease Cas1